MENERFIAGLRPTPCQRDKSLWKPIKETRENAHVFAGRIFLVSSQATHIAREAYIEYERSEVYIEFAKQIYRPSPPAGHSERQVQSTAVEESLQHLLINYTRK